MILSCVVRSFLFALLIYVSSAPQLALACSCAGGSLEGKYERSENVFTAVITGGEATNERVGNSPKLKTYFEATETFKGTIPFEHFSSHADGNSCGISLQVGVEYLIFAPDTGKIGLCSGIVAVSGVSEQGEAIGSKYVDALRAFKSGKNEGLPEPWQFFEQHGICRLSGRFPYGERKWPASINVTYRTSPPENTVPDPDAPHFQPGYVELSIWVPGREDLSGFPLSLQVNEDEYIARWEVDDYKRGRYLVHQGEVIDLVTGLEHIDALRMTSGHPEYGDINAEASLINAGDSITRMVSCVSGRQRRASK